MNTERSKKKAADYLKNGNQSKRKTQTYQKVFSFPAEKVFYQFCPTRELDWIGGWDCDLVYTTSGYVESDCIFKTSETNPLGPGLWIFTRYEPNRFLELIRVVEESMVIHFRIDLQDNSDGTSTGTWNLTFTALNQSGNAMVDSIPEDDSEMKRAIDGLEYFLQTGELMSAKPLTE